MVTRTLLAMGAAIAMSLIAGVWSSATQSVAQVSCKPAGTLVRLAGLPEASGLAASSTPGRFWTHNDSGRPEIFGLDATGKVTGRVTVTGASVQDWEAIASAPCRQGSCLYVADIGDNNRTRQHITIYRVPEPSADSGSATVDGVFRASYPDGAHDAETLLVGPDGVLYVVTKGDAGPVALYRFPRELRTDTTVRLERVASPLASQPDDEARITDGAISADGNWVALRTSRVLSFYRAADFLQGNFREAHRVDLGELGEPQGEGVAFGPQNRVYLVGEGGGHLTSGTLAILTCVL